MPNTLTEKALAQPFRMGIMLGALTLPTLWVANRDAWSWLQGRRMLNSEEVTQLFAIGFLPGMILGAGALRAWVAWKAGKLNQARWLLLGHGGFVALFAGALLAQDLRRLHGLFQSAPTRPPEFLSHSMPMWFSYVSHIAGAVPLQISLAMFLLGLFMRSSRA